MFVDGGDSDGEVEVGRERGSKRTGEDGRGRERIRSDRSENEWKEH